MRAAEDRITLVLLGFLVVLTAVIGRCFWLQVVDAGQYREYAESQHRVSQRLLALRGAIYDRKGRVLAQTVMAPSVFANARMIQAKEEMAKHLAGLIGGETGFIQKRLEKDKGFVWLKRQTHWDIMPDLNKLKRSGVGVLEESRRIYPNGSLAAHVLGFVDVDHRGLEGLELRFQRILQGQDGWRSGIRDARGKALMGPWTEWVEPVSGHSITLTVDSVVQQVAEEVLEWGVDEFNAKGGSVTVMDPETGAVLALANWPKYDPNAPGSVKTEQRRNRAVTDLFEPGSTFKIITAAALLEEGRITPEEPIFCENGEYATVGRHVLHDHSPHGTLAFRDVVRVSSNIGTSKAAQRLKPEELYRYIRAFGFGERTGIELPGEVRGRVHAPNRWSKLSPYIIPIGHEVAVTPIQLAQMAAIVANGGHKVKPHIIEKIESPTGEVIQKFDLGIREVVISRETAEIVQDMLASVVASGTGRRANVKGLTVAGKTGTAQKLEPNGRYSHSRFVASFVGFVPVPDAKLVIVVNMDEPRPVYFGGSVSAPMFRRMVEELRSYLELPKESEETLDGNGE
jgi:cell division protein FtsI (penicillin-binding protein 3)